jgi:hypothetical protein
MNAAVIKAEALVAAKQLGLKSDSIVFSDKLEWVGVDGELRLRKLAVSAGRAVIFLGAITARLPEDKVVPCVLDLVGALPRVFDEAEHPRDSDGRFTFAGGADEAGAAEFIAARDQSSRSQFMSPLKPADLSQHVLLTNKDKTAGVAIDPHGDLQNLFNNSSAKGEAAHLVAEAIKHGARTLDCYDGFLPAYYRQFGFQETSRLKFNPEFAHDWDMAKYGQPDVVFMAWKGYGEGGEKAAIGRAMSRQDWVPNERTDKYGDDFDAAKTESRAQAKGAGADSAPGKGSRASLIRSGNRLGPGASESDWRDLDWDESEHPRDEDGRFTFSGGGPDSSDESAYGGLVMPPTAPPLNPEVIAVSGDDWNKQTAVRLETDYQRVKPELEALTDRGVHGEEIDTPTGEPDENYMDDAPFVPDEWESMGDDLQQEAENAYLKQTYDDYLNSEIDNWHDNGDALDDAKAQLAQEFGDGDKDEWARDALQDWLDGRAENEKPVPYTLDQIMAAISLDYATGYEGNGDLTVEFDDNKLMHPSTLIEGQGTLPGIEEIVPSSALSIEMRDEIEQTINTAFDKAAEKLEGDLDPPDYLGDNVSEYQKDNWDSMDSGDKFSWTQHNTSIIDALQEEYDAYVKEHEDGVPETAEVKLPSQFDPLQNSGDSINYKRTQVLATYLSLNRQLQLLKERGIDDDPDRSRIAAIDRSLWESWKASSTSYGGQILQLATADELGGRYRDLPTHRTDLIKQADENYPSIGGYAGIKALVRAKWETSQFLLDKAGIDTVDVYRGIKMDLPADEPIEPVAFGTYKNEYQRIPDATILRNGAFSTTTDRSVANNWGGGYGNTKVVIRIEAPRTSVLSIPAYGINVHGEHEVVLAGTAWKHWDAFKGVAPSISISDVPIKVAA